MDAIALIDKYYADNPRLRELLWIHSRQVADRCLKIAALHPELDLDKAFWKKQLCCMISAFCIPTLPVFYVRETHLIFATVISGRRCCVRKGFRSMPGCASVIPARGFHGKKSQRKACRYPYRIIIRRLWKNSSSVMRINFIPNPIPTGKKHRNRR